MISAIIDEIKASFKEGIKSIVKTTEQEIYKAFFRFKRKTFRFAIELMLVVLSIAFILVGGVLALDNFFPIEWVLLITGIVVLNLVLITGRFR